VPTLSDVLAFLQQILTQLTYSLAPIGVILQNVLITAKETSPFEIRGYTKTAAAYVTDGTYGLPALAADIAALSAQLAAAETAIELAVGTPQQTGSPVTLPGTFDQDVCNAVWNNTPYSYPRTMGYAVVNTAQSVIQASYLGIPPQIGHFLVASVDFASQDFVLPGFTYPTWDPGDVLIGDTLLSMMTRQNPGFTCAYGNPPQTNVLLTEPLGAGISWITDLDETAFSELKQFYFPLTAFPTAPVWPGLANVTLLTPVALATSLTISEAMDGVLVSITAVPTKQGQFAFGDLISWRNAGALAFVEDNGDAEYPQNLGFQSAVYLPKAMAHCSGVVVRASPGVTGTVTPFTINA